MVRHRRGHVGRSNGGLLRDRPSSLSPRPRATDPRCHGPQEYGGIEYGGLPVAPSGAATQSVSPADNNRPVLIVRSRYNWRVVAVGLAELRIAMSVPNEIAIASRGHDLGTESAGPRRGTDAGIRASPSAAI